MATIAQEQSHSLPKEYQAIGKLFPQLGVSIYERRKINCRICGVEHEVQTVWDSAERDTITFTCTSTSKSWEVRASY